MRWVLHVLSALAVAASLAASESGDATGRRYLFNGKDLSGWAHVGPGGFTVEGGALKTTGGMGLLWYKAEPLGNVKLRVVYRNPGGANSGVFVRIPEKPTEVWMPVYRGYEVQIYDQADADDYHCTGTLESLTRAMAKPGHPDEWNTMEITLEGDHTSVSINGVLVTDYHEGQAVPPKKERWEPDRGPRPVIGYIGLQNYGPDDVVYFREVSVSAVKP